jgi:MoxR-like ATPase
MMAELKRCVTAEGLTALQQSVRAVFASPALYDYLQAIISHTRQSPDLVTGLSPRGGLNLLHAARAWALLEGRAHVLPEDLQAVLPSVVGHRLQTAEQQPRARDELARRLLAEVPVP